MPFKIYCAPKKEEGLTLVEVLLSLVMLSLITSGLIGVFVPTTMWVTRARNETTAANYAYAILENLRSDRETVTSFTSGESADDLWGDHEYKPAEPGSISSSIVKSPLGGDLFEITVTVSWNQGEQSHDITMISIISGE